MIKFKDYKIIPKKFNIQDVKMGETFIIRMETQFVYLKCEKSVVCLLTGRLYDISQFETCELTVVDIDATITNFKN